jgi:hypothetical protein
LPRKHHVADLSRILKVRQMTIPDSAGSDPVPQRRLMLAARRSFRTGGELDRRREWSAGLRFKPRAIGDLR